MARFKIPMTAHKAVIAVLALFLPFLSSATNQNTMLKPTSPDFAFPRTVAENARNDLQASLARGDSQNALLAAMQIAMAETSIDAESISSSLELLDSVAFEVNSPLVSALADAAQASLLHTLCQSRRRQIDLMQPIGEEEEKADAKTYSDLNFWSRERYASRILELQQRAWGKCMPYRTQSIMDIAFCLEAPAGFKGTGLTVGDFFRSQAFSTLEDFLPQGSLDVLLPLVPVANRGELTPEERVEAWLSQLMKDWVSDLASSKECPAPRWQLAIDCQSSFIDEDYRKMKDFLFSIWPSVKGSEGELPFLKAACDVAELNSSLLEERKAFFSEGNLYELMQSAVASHPKSRYVPALRNLMADMGKVSLQVVGATMLLPGERGKVSVSNTNCTSGYLLLFSVANPNGASSMSLKRLLSSGRLLEAIPVTCSKEVPFSLTQTLELPPLSPGYYALVGSRLKTKAGIPGNVGNPDVDLLTVTELAAVTQSFVSSSTGNITIVSGRNGAPVADARVSLLKRDRRTEKPTLLSRYTSDSLGLVTPGRLREWPDEMCVSKGKDELFQRVNLHPTGSYGRKSTRCKVFTDLPIVRPGDRIQFAVVCYEVDGGSIRLLANRKLRAALTNASGAEVDTLSLLTDSSGRCEASFPIPKEGLLGTWEVEVAEHHENRISRWQGWLGKTTFKVEQYKNPTFRLILSQEETPEGLYPDSPLRINGRVETFSGMAIPGTKVSLMVSTRRGWGWWRPARGASCHFDVLTDAAGNFTLDLPVANLKGTEWETGLFQVEGVATSPGGETQSATLCFTLGKGFSIRPAIPSKLEVTCDEVALNVPLYSIDGTPAAGEIEYELTDRLTGKSLKGVFQAPILRLPASELPSGEWKANFRLASVAEADAQDGETAQKPTLAKTNFILWRDSDTVPPTDSPLWTPKEKVFVPQGADSVKLTIGSRKPGQAILCLVSSQDKEVERRWVYPNGENVKIELPAPPDTARFSVELVTYSDLEPCRETVSIIPALQEENLKVETISFRNRLNPGSHEEWKFRFTFDGMPARGVNALAVMTDKAIDLLASSDWSLSPRSFISYSSFTRLDTRYPGRIHEYWTLTPPGAKRLKTWNVPDPGWAYGFGSGYDLGYCSMELKRVMTTSAPLMEMAVDGEDVDLAPMAGGMKSSVTNSMMDSAKAEEESPTVGLGTADGGSSSEEPDVAWRQAEHPLAFFMPMLRADDDGELSVDFEVPDFNTTWKFQMAGYDARLHSAVAEFESVASKKVMASISLPRYLRSGDKAMLTATLYNNSDSELELGGEFADYAPDSAKPLASMKLKPETTAPGKSRVVRLDIDVPLETGSLLLKAYAKGGGHTDGEQAPVVVFPATLPTMESEVFYLHPGQREFSVKLPQMRKGSKVTLLYCNNPSWYALTAIPALTQDVGPSVTSIANALYGSATAAGLLENDPTIRKGLETLIREEAEGKGNGMLRSRLELNQQLKAVGLSSTPWVNDAASETARLASLGSLLDDSQASSVIEDLEQKMVSMQKPGGGFAWLPDFKEPSEWATSIVILRLAQLRASENATHVASLTDMFQKGDRFLRKALVGDWKENKRDVKAVALRMVDLLYAETLFGKERCLDVPDFPRLREQTLDWMESSWRDMTIGGKAMASMVLADNGRREKALEVLRSIEELAVSSPEKGMWFPNLGLHGSGGFWLSDKLQTVCLAIRAWETLEPGAKEAAQLRQWLLLQRQAEEWSDLNSAADAVQALLGGGHSGRAHGMDLLGADSRKLELKLGRHKVDLGGELPDWGEAVIDIDASMASGATLRVVRGLEGDSNALPQAWGAVVSQYCAPPAEVRAQGAEGLSIEKKLYLVREKDGREELLPVAGEELRVGDSLRVVLELTTDRDLEYLNITDQRSSTLEPLQPMSGLVWDGMGVYYREIRASETNLFLEFLRKGSWQFSYDCRVSMPGTFASGPAMFQSSLAPQLTARSGAEVLTIGE